MKFNKNWQPSVIEKVIKNLEDQEKTSDIKKRCANKDGRRIMDKERKMKDEQEIDRNKNS